MRIVALVLLLAGCYLPAEMIDRGKKHTSTSTLKPRQAANCVAENVKYVAPNLYRASLVELGEPETFEVVVTRRLYPVEGAMVVVHIRSSATGSAVTIYTHPDQSPSSEAHWLKTLREGC